MNRKDYQKPQMNMVDIPQRVYLLAGSITPQCESDDVAVEDYDRKGEQDW